MLAIAGCSEDNTHPKVSPVDEPSADAVTILATIDAIPSATGDGEAYAPLWQEGDQIVVGYKGISYVYETYDAGNGVEFHPMALSLPADARGEVTAYFKAVDGVFAVGADQTGATLPMYAYAADAAPAQGSLGLHFKPLASVLSLTIGEEASKTISKITLEPVDPDGVEGHLAVSEAVVDPRTGAVTVGEDAAVSDILTMEIGEMSLVQAQTVNFLIVSGTKVDGGLKATISCTDGSVFVKNLFETQEVAFAGNCVGAATELFFRLRIATYEDMVNFAQECADDNGGAIVDLQADIDMRNVPWTPIENFTGTFNGNGHRIYNINVSADGRYAGFFAYAKGAISDVVFGSKDGTSYDGTSRIELKYSADTDTWCYAGIVAQSNNTLTGVTSFVPVTVTADSRCKSRTGGIVGSLYNGKMSGCRNYGAVSNVATAGVASYVAYIKALGTEKYTVTVTQTGGEGITAASGSYSISAAGNGYIEVPLTGTATRQGIVTFAVKAMDEAGAEKDFGSVSTIVRAGFDAQGEELPLLTQNFGKFPWGGDCIGQKAGVTTADKTVANLSLDNETVSVTAGTNASIGGITSTVRNGNAAFYRAIGMEGWTGYLNYMCPGYIQLGAASDNADGQPGNLISPVLNIPAGYDLLLTCKVAIWAAAPDQGMVGICEKNDGFWIPKGTLDKIVASTKSYVSLDIPAYTWVEVTAVIPNPGAKANLAFFISTADSWFSGSSVKAGRWYIDDIKLVY